jgi:hypothetical protein
VVRQPDIKIDLPELNHTELVTLCHWVGIKEASRGWTRELLIQALEQFETYPDLKTSIDVKKKRLSSFLKLRWDQMQMQVDKRACPNCHLCRDLQVMECYRPNKLKIEGTR